MGLSDGDKAARDAFGRARVSTPTTLFDSKQLGGDQLAAFWNDVETSGGGTSSTYNQASSSTTLSVSATTAGKRVRQTYQYWNYQPGKSHEIIMTFVMGSPTAGVTKRVGYFNGTNGVYLEQTGSGWKLGIVSDASGEVVREEKAQANWSINRFDGDDGPELDPTKAQIFFIDMEWLGVGTVRCGFVIDGVLWYAHAFHHANIVSAVYMKSGTLPLRYEIENDGTGAAASLISICSTVISEGGSEITGATYTVTNGATQVDANTAGTIYAVLGYKLRSDHLYNVARPVSLNMYSKGNIDFEWAIYIDPTVAGTFTYSDFGNTSIQVATGATANTITDASWLIRVAGGYGTTTVATTQSLGGLRYPGSSVAGTPEAIVVAVRPLGNNADIFAALTIQESS